MKRLNGITGLFVLVMIIAIAFVFSGCSVANKTTALTGDILTLSNQVDDLQEALGEYSSNQDVLAECDRLQTDIRLALGGDIGKLQLQKYSSQSAVIYKTMKQEIVSRWGELSPFHQEQLMSLERDYLLITSQIQALKNEVSGNETGRQLLMFLATAANAYAAYEGAN